MEEETLTFSSYIGECLYCKVDEMSLRLSLEAWHLCVGLCILLDI